MKKQELINLKKKLEQRVLIFDTWGNEGPFSMYEIEQRINTEGSVQHIENYFESLIEYFSNKKVKYDEMTIYLQFGIFVSDKYVDKDFYLKENAKPVNNLLLVAVSGFNYRDSNQMYQEDPESIMKEAYVPFVISFDKFITLLRANGFELEGINDFDTIVEKIKSNELIKTSITIKFKNAKTKKKNYIKGKIKMGNNSKKLDSWHKCISSYEELDLATAKKLYLEIQNETNKIKKQIKREQLITGTLYVIYKFIKKNNLRYINSSVYDMDDIINVCNEIWITMIDQGKLLKVNKYSEIFDYQFYSELTDKLVSSKFSIAENTILDIDVFADFLHKFIEVLKNKDELTYNDYINLLITSSDDEYKYKKILYKIFGKHLDVSETYNLLNSIYKSMQKDEDISISKRKIDMLKYILINNGLEAMRQSINDVIEEDTAETIITEMYLTKLKEIIFNECNLTETEIRIIKNRYGIDGEHSHTLEEIALEENLSKERIRQKETKILRKLKRNKNLRNNFYV